MNLTEQAHAIIGNFLKKIPKPLAIDASCGNGHDTLFLAKICSHVFAFDIQESAINATRTLLKENGLDSRLEIFMHSHSDMSSMIASEYRGKIHAAVFNLGWLPHSDKSVITKPESTVAALESLKLLLDPRQNLVSVLAYRGHGGGAEEFEAVRDFAQNQNAEIFGDISNPRSPILFSFSV